MDTYLIYLKLYALLSKPEIALIMHYTLEVTQIYQVSPQKAMLK